MEGEIDWHVQSRLVKHSCRDTLIWLDLPSPTTWCRTDGPFRAASASFGRSLFSRVVGKTNKINMAEQTTAWPANWSNSEQGKAKQSGI